MTALNVLELTLETSAGVKGVSHHAWLIVHSMCNSTVGVAVMFPESVEHVWEGTIMQTVGLCW